MAFGQDALASDNYCNNQTKSGIIHHRLEHLGKWSMLSPRGNNIQTLNASR